MPFQTAVNIYNTAGVVGEIAYAGPTRATPYNLVSTPELNYIGRAFTVVSGANPNPVYNVPSMSTLGAPLAGTAKVGGTGVFAGILINPKEYVTYGTAAGGSLAPSLILPENAIGTCLTMGQIWVALAAGAANVGDFVVYDNTTGELAALANDSSFTGVIATNTLTVSAFVAGGAPLRVGTKISGANVNPGTYITALGTGTGGDGTYTVNQTTASSSAMFGDAVAPTGKTLVPNCVVSRFDVASSGGLAVIELTN